MIALADKNAIQIIEFARELGAEGMATVDAAVEATRRRFRPILMTSIPFILGTIGVTRDALFNRTAQNRA